MSHLWKRTLIALTLVTLTGCGLSELPDGKEGYVGSWLGETTILFITHDAGVDYTRGDSNSSTHISGQIVRFEDDDFVVYAVMNFSFDVTEPPHVVEITDGNDSVAKRHMTVNGEDVTAR